MKSRNKIHVLYIPRWYPSRADSMLGLFVRNHALAAASAGYKITVAYASKNDQKLIKSFEKSFSTASNINEIIVYYNGSSIISPVLQVLAWVMAIRLAIKTHGKPDLIHAHVLTRPAFISWVLSKVYKIPYLITEHWSRYYDENPNFKGGLRKFMTRRLIANAALTTVVSRRLYEAMRFRGLQFDELILPNVVDTDIFKPTDIKNNTFTFVNISCFDERSKNLKLLLDSANELFKTVQSFNLHLVGEGVDREYIEQYAAQLNPELPVKFSGLKNPLEVSSILKESNCLVLSSNYETFGIVVFEALATGIPVIVTDVADLKEIISPTYGTVVPVGNKISLSNAMQEMMRTHKQFNPVELHQLVVKSYSKNSIAIILDQLYQRVIKK